MIPSASEDTKRRWARKPDNLGTTKELGLPTLSFRARGGVRPFSCTNNAPNSRYNLLSRDPLTFPLDILIPIDQDAPS